MTSREKFEAFLVSEYEWGNDALNAANFHGDDATGYYTGGDFIYDGQSCSEGLFWAWRGWQAAELAAEKKLTDMAVQLANAESKCRELAAENVTLNDKMNRLATWPGIEFYSSAWEFCNLDGNDALEFMCDVKTPDTDAFLAEVRAQGVEMFAKNAEGAEQGNGLMKAIARRAAKFAAQLRKGSAL